MFSLYVGFNETKCFPYKTFSLFKPSRSQEQGTYDTWLSKTLLSWEPSFFISFLEWWGPVFNHEISLDARFHAKQNTKNLNTLSNVNNDIFKSLSCLSHVAPCQWKRLIATVACNLILDSSRLQISSDCLEFSRTQFFSSTYKHQIYRFSSLRSTKNLLVGMKMVWYGQIPTDMNTYSYSISQI